MSSFLKKEALCVCKNKLTFEAALFLEDEEDTNAVTTRERKQVRFSEVNSDPDSYDDEVDLFHKQKDKILLDSDHEDSDVNSVNEQEIFPVADSSSDDDEEIRFLKQQIRHHGRNKFKQDLHSDLDEDEVDEEADEQTPAADWGKKKFRYYGGDVRGNRIDLQDDGKAALETMEGLKMAKQQESLLTKDDFLGFDVTSDKDREDYTGERAVNLDFGKLSEKKAVKVMEKIHPLFCFLWKDFCEKGRELVDRIIPLMGLVKQGKMLGRGADYIRLKFHIISNYLTNGAFYVHLVETSLPSSADVSKLSGLNRHPVIARIDQYRNMYNQLSVLDGRHKRHLDAILTKLKTGGDIGVIDTDKTEVHRPGVTSALRAGDRRDGKSTGSVPSASLSGSARFGADRMPWGEDDKMALSDGESDGEEVVDNRQGFAGPAVSNGLTNDSEDARRALTTLMERNKGYMTQQSKSKKKKNNPRVKHRNKFRKATVRRKGQVRDYVSQMHPYTGEISGIRSGIIRSRKLK